MAITTDNGKLAVMELDLDWEPGLPLSPGALDQADLQQLLWGFPEILWEEEEAEVLVPGGVIRRALPSWSRTVRRSLPSWNRVWRYSPMSNLATESAPALIAAVSDDRDYGFDCTDAPELATGTGITISSGEILGGSGLTVGSVSVLAAEFDGIPAGKGLSVRASGGVAGTTYKLACKVTLSNGRTFVVPGRMSKVADYAS